MAVAGPPELPFAPTIPNLIHAQAARFADRDFVVDQHQRLTYRDADTRSAALAKQLVAAGVGKGTRVCLVFPPGDALCIVFTSGVTGEPKGALHCHGAFVRHSANLAPIQGLLESDRLYTTMPMFWVGGITVTTLALMHLGATVLCEERLDPPRTLDLIERERATLVVGWQYAMTSLGEDPSFPQRDLSSVRDGPLL